MTVLSAGISQPAYSFLVAAEPSLLSAAEKGDKKTVIRLINKQYNNEQTPQLMGEKRN